MLTLSYAEVMASYACDLSCTGCTNYSNYHYSGHPKWEGVRDHLQAWLPRIEFTAFGVIGGEPLLNPRLEEWLIGIRALMPRTELVLVTNGNRLRQTADVIDWMVACAPGKLTIAAHRDVEEVRSALLDLVAASTHPFVPRPFTYVDRDGVSIEQLNFVLESPRVVIEFYRPRVFVKSYRGFGADMRPWDHDDPQGAIEQCACRYCPLLFEGRLYKCSPIALLRRHLERLGLSTIDDWQPYLRYSGIDASDPVEKLEAFIRLFGRPERICRMCPSRSEPGAVIDHTTTSVSKVEWLSRHGTAWPPRPREASGGTAE